MEIRTQIRRQIRTFIGISLMAALGACSQEPTPECQAYVACQQAYDEATGAAPVDVTQYQPDGACWDSADNAARCTADCQAGLDALRGSAASEGLEIPSC